MKILAVAIVLGALRIVDRTRHALVFAEASQRCLRELLELIEKEAAGDEITEGLEAL